MAPSWEVEAVHTKCDHTAAMRINFPASMLLLDQSIMYSLIEKRSLRFVYPREVQALPRWSWYGNCRFSWSISHPSHVSSLNALPHSFDLPLGSFWIEVFQVVTSHRRGHYSWVVLLRVWDTMLSQSKHSVAAVLLWSCQSFFGSWGRGTYYNWLHSIRILPSKNCLLFWLGHAFSSRRHPLIYQ